MKTPQLFHNHNKQLLSKLIPCKTEPIHGNTIIDVKNELFNLSFEEICQHLKNS